MIIINIINSEKVYKILICNLSKTNKRLFQHFTFSYRF